MKRLISMTVGLALAATLWSGPAWAGSEVMEGTAIVRAEQSHHGQEDRRNPITRLFSNVRSTLQP